MGEDARYRAGAGSVEPLECRLLFAGASGVVLYHTDGSVATINPAKVEWLLFHGLYGSKADVQDLAAAVGGQLPAGAEVLLVDWSALASVTASPDTATAVTNAWKAGDAVAGMIRAAGGRASRVNLIGFSLGGQVEDRLAKDLRGRHDRINRLIAVDAAAPKVGVNGSGHGVHVVPQFAGNVTYSLAFVGDDNYGYIGAGLTADDTVLMRGLSADGLTRHVETSEIFLRMMQRDAGLEAAGDDHVSGVFSIANVFAGAVPGWRKDEYAPGYEGVMDCAVDGTGALEPVTLTYVNRRGHTVRV